VTGLPEWGRWQGTSPVAQESPAMSLSFFSRLPAALGIGFVAQLPKRE